MYGSMATKKDAKKAEKLLKEWIEWCRGNHDKREDCDVERFIDWNCCDFHRKLNKQHENFRECAQALDVCAGNAMLLSPHWWERLGKETGVNTELAM